MHARDAFSLALALAAVLGSTVVAIAFGSVDLRVDRVAGLLLDALHGGERGGWRQTVLLHVRMPRVVLAIVAGGGLAVAGAVLQGLFRNPMADPAVLGVSGGAAFGAVLALYAVPAAASFYAVPVASFACGAGCAFTVYALATRRGHTPVSTILLAGIAVGGIANALTSFVLSLAVSEWEVGREMLKWLMGSLEGRSWRHVAMVTPLAIGGSAWLGMYARDLNVLITGEENALSVGVDVPAVKRNLVVLASLVTAATVAVMGIVAFVGLMIPHIVRLLVGPDHRRLLPLSFLVGSLFLLWADFLCRVAPLADLRLGVVTALAGGPFFLFLLLRHRTYLGVA